MKGSLNILITFYIILVSANVFAQSDVDEVKKVLSQYKNSLEKLDVTGTDVLFVSNSQIVESGKVEGTYQDYLANHIGPELGDFKSFKFDNYKVDVTVSDDYAFSVETYNYTIVFKKDNADIKRKGVATSFLKRENGVWKIVHMHNSSRKP